MYFTHVYTHTHIILTHTHTHTNNLEEIDSRGLLLRGERETEYCKGQEKQKKRSIIEKRKTGWIFEMTQEKLRKVRCLNDTKMYSFSLPHRSKKTWNGLSEETMGCEFMRDAEIRE